MVFSIVTPTFKQPDWVRLCANSVADQIGVTFEHIVQDGGDGQGLEWLPGIPTARLFVEPDRLSSRHTHLQHIFPAERSGTRVVLQG